jgi:predicted PurR-regulated permease PerM
VRRGTNLNDAHSHELELFARKAAIASAFAIGLVFLWMVRHVLVLLVISAALAAGIAPAVTRVRTVARKVFHRRIARGPAVVIVYLPFLATVLLLIVFGGPRLLAESRTLGAELPVLIEQKLLEPLAAYLPIEDLRKFLDPATLKDEMPIFGYLRGAITAVVSVVAVLFMIFYMLIDADRLRNLFLLFFPAEQRAARKRMITRMGRRMSAWLSGQLVLGTIIGTTTFIGFVIIGIPYAFPLAILAGIGEMIPVIGPIAGAIPALIVALFGPPWQFWAVLVFAIAIQQFENYLLVPRFMGKRVSVSPLAIFTAFLMGASLFGIVGALMAIPVAAVVQVAFDEAFISRRERREAGRRGSLFRNPPAE